MLLLELLCFSTVLWWDKNPRCRTMLFWHCSNAMYCKSIAETMQYTSLWLHFILLYVILCSVFSQWFGRCGAWYLVFSRCKRHEHRYGSCWDVPGGWFLLCPLLPLSRHTMAPAVPCYPKGHGSVLACQVRICFSCTQGFRVVAGKLDSLLLLLEEEMVQVRKGCLGKLAAPWVAEGVGGV